MRKGKKLALWAKLLIGLLCVIMVLVGAISYTFLKVTGKLNTQSLNEDDLSITSDDEIESVTDSDSYTDIVNIALFGIDSTDSESGRSDAIMVATLDPIHNKLKITSFMRDSYVYVNEEYGYTKLTHAYAYGGATLAISTLNSNFGLNISDYIAVDFETLPNIIDSLGGITLDITEEELEYINQYIDNINDYDGTDSAHITTAGTQQVDGVQALAYSRIRYTSGSDFTRTERQRTVLNAMFEKIMNLSTSEQLSLINTYAEDISTSLSTTEILSLGSQAISMALSGVSLEQNRYPQDGYWSDYTTSSGMEVLQFDEDATKEQVMQYIYNDVDITEDDDSDN